MLQIDCNPASEKGAPPNGPGSLPSRLGRYEIQSALGSGMMGLVYKAWDPLLGRPVAVKVLRNDLPVREDERQLMEQRFLREASLAATLSHPCIVVVHDFGRDPDTHTPYIAFEYLEGRTLAESMSPLPLDWREALRLTARLARALHHAHGQGTIHRDVKPANIMVLPSGEPKILDFGIARAAAGQLTAVGESWGTPSYMSPEQATASAVDGRSDLFSLGSVLYELLTGRRAFGADGVVQVMARVIHEEPPPPTSANPALPAGVDTIMARALAKKPAERYADGQAFAEDVEDVLEGRRVRDRIGLRDTAPLASSDASVATQSTPAPARRGGFREASRPLRGWAAGVVLGAAVGVAVMLGPAASAPEEPVAQVAAMAVPVVSNVSTPWATPSAAASTAPVPVPAKLPAEARAAESRPKTRQQLAPKAAPHQPTEALASEPLPMLAHVRLHGALANLPQPRLAHVSLAVQHGFEHGQLKVWVDGALVLDTALASTQTRKLLFLKRRKGSLAEVRAVLPGERLLRFEVVADDGARRSAELSGVFKSDETRILEVKLGGKVELKWKS